MSDNLILANEYESFRKRGFIKDELPRFVYEGISQKIDLRPYQVKALSNFFYYISEDSERAKPTHLLFHMATGSGKTVIMAFTMLYLYSIGYRNFLFFVNSTNIIEKTKSNFLDKNSIKYLFSDVIKVGNKNVEVIEQDNFQHIRKDDINIVFTTIQGLHTTLNNPKENSLTFDDFEDKKIVLLSDEAHHINALTKKSLNQADMDIQGTWENTVQRIFEASKENILLEFTATVDMEHIKIREKYEPKLIYKYTLKEFREDRYSKEVKVLESDTNNLERALQALIISQYRRKVAQDNKIYLKPVVLFKSKTIKESEEFENSFYEYIETLKPIDLEKVSLKQLSILKKAFSYFEENKITYENLISELQEEFSEDKCVSVNSQNQSEEKQILVNTLEDRNNEIRGVFAVDKLNEGWDVLNLFDIVRLYDTRDSKGSKVGKTTMAEAQLIGRGARYFPFQIEEHHEKHKRKYDENIDSDLRVLEELYYHSAYNPRYISELNQALIETGIKAQEERELPLKLKETFKDSKFWKTGYVYVNKRIENKNEDKKTVNDFQYTKLHKHSLESNYSKESTILNPNSDLFDISKEHKPENITKRFQLGDLGENVVSKAFDKFPFYNFSNLRTYIPNYTSRNQFLDDLAKEVLVEVRGSKTLLNDLSQNLKLDICISILKTIKSDLEAENKKFIGTNTFYAYQVKDTFKDTRIKVSIDENSDKEFGKPMSLGGQTNIQLNLFEHDWYAYEEDYGTSEEKYLVRFISTAIEKLKEKYKDIYLVRNAKAVKIYSFDDGRAFEPDYILFLTSLETNVKMYYQIFIEPKGKHLIKEDSWKQEFLEKINTDAKPEIIHSDRKYNLIGLPFFNEEVTKLEFVEAFETATS